MDATKLGDGEGGKEGEGGDFQGDEEEDETEEADQQGDTNDDDDDDMGDDMGDEMAPPLSLPVVVSNLSNRVVQKLKGPDADKSTVTDIVKERLQARQQAIIEGNKTVVEDRIRFHETGWKAR